MYENIKWSVAVLKDIKSVPDTQSTLFFTRTVTTSQREGLVTLRLTPMDIPNLRIQGNTWD